MYSLEWSGLFVRKMYTLKTHFHKSNQFQVKAMAIAMDSQRAIIGCKLNIEFVFFFLFF